MHAQRKHSGSCTVLQLLCFAVEIGGTVLYFGHGRRSGRRRDCGKLSTGEGAVKEDLRPEMTARVSRRGRNRTPPRRFLPGAHSSSCAPTMETAG